MPSSVEVISLTNNMAALSLQIRNDVINERTRGDMLLAMGELSRMHDLLLQASAIRSAPAGVTTYMWTDFQNAYQAAREVYFAANAAWPGITPQLDGVVDAPPTVRTGQRTSSGQTVQPTSGGKGYVEPGEWTEPSAIKELNPSGGGGLLEFLFPSNKGWYAQPGMWGIIGLSGVVGYSYWKRSKRRSR